jgi:hypothetical protein
VNWSSPCTVISGENSSGSMSNSIDSRCRISLRDLKSRIAIDQNIKYASAGVTQPRS